MTLDCDLRALEVCCDAFAWWESRLYGITRSLDAVVLTLIVAHLSKGTGYLLYPHLRNRGLIYGDRGGHLGLTPFIVNPYRWLSYEIKNLILFKIYFI